MRQTDRAEAATLLRAVLTALLAQPAASDAAKAAALRVACGKAAAGAETDISTGDFAPTLRDCFDLAVGAGVDADGFARVRAVPEAATPASALGGVVVALAIRLALTAECVALAGMEIPTRDAADTLIARLRTAFGDAIDFAQDGGESAAARALSALYAAAVRDLTERGRLAPRSVTYSTAVALPSLVLSQRLYGSAERADELVARNGVRHPLFMPLRGVALSA